MATTYFAILLHMHYTCYKLTKLDTKTNMISAEILVLSLHSFRTFSSLLINLIINLANLKCDEVLLVSI